MEVAPSLAAAEKKELLAIAHRSVIAAVSRTSYVPEKPVSTVLMRKAGAFVTLREKRELRGCIGYIEARIPLYQTVAETAARAAIGDPRFEPVSEGELKDIEVEISALSPLQETKNIDDIVIGKHGILIETGFNRGLLLPQVATENNWNREQFLSYTCLKAGLSGDCYLKPGVRISIFTAEVFSEEELGATREEAIIEGK